MGIRKRRPVHRRMGPHWLFVYAPNSKLVRLSRMSIADEMREEHRRRVLIRCYAFRNSSGSLAIFAAIRRASSFVSNLRLTTGLRLVLIIDVCELLPVMISHDEIV
jgi:hypothetical protein